MLTDKEILTQIKAAVQEVIPDAKVYLFGSRARGDWHEESDWDILVLTKEKQPKKVKWQIHDKLFPYSVSIGALFQFIVAPEDDWNESPEYYSFNLMAKDELQLI